MQRGFIAWVIGFVWAFSTSSAQTNVWMLVPGFTVHELPIRLSNVNNLRFAPDGRLTALAYDGRVHILSDTDGDGVEDHASVFWDKPTLSVPVGMAWAKEGLYVSSHGKVSLLRDTDGDGVADTEEIVAAGWPPTDVGSGGVDATAVTLDAEGNIYFGLLTADYSNPYRVKEGVSHYDLNGKRGTIQKCSAATRQLSTIATGIRVPYTLAFNRHGDLFVTDQEGETWCPGGNPLDELNHIIPGRNYGFPPRDEKYLPKLISEPPVVAFGPQHQSTCGLVFNEAAAGQKSFGPFWWDGAALVAGESRGKIWRVPLVKTPAGYLGRETLIARLNMLATDVAISPRGDLYVSCHSGSPDWGTGPKGEGKIFKISYADTNAPQPVAIWSSSPMEVSLGFDRPIDFSVTNRVDGMTIEFGEHVCAADRLETLKPPYKTVKQQEATPRGKLRVVSAVLSADQRTLSLTTDPHPQAVRYALTLPGVQAADPNSSLATVDLAYDLSGVQADWFENGNATAEWHGWLPHLDSQVNMAFTGKCADHERLLNLVRRKGSLQLRTQLALPVGAARLRFEASIPFDFNVGGKTAKVRAASTRLYIGEVSLDLSDQSLPLLVKLETGLTGTLGLQAAYSTEVDPTPRPLPFGSLLLPWAPPHQAPLPLAAEKTELAGGDYERGRSLFFGPQLNCVACHRVRGEGAIVGPDLSNLVHRDSASVLRDILDPNAMINPDYVAYNVWLRDEEAFNGFVRAQTGGSLRLLDSSGKEQIVRRGDVSDMQPSALSLMPTGLLEGMKEGQVRDLLTFLMEEPPMRSRAELEAVLRHDARGTPDAEHALKPLNLVLVASKQDHGPGQHDYPAWQKKWMALFGAARNVTVRDAWEWPTPEQWRSADLVIFYFWNHNWSPERYQQLDDYQARGGGVAVFHAATIADKEPEKLAERIGLAAQPGPTKYLHTPVLLNFVAPTNHPIATGFNKLNLLDEPYWPMIGDTSRIEVLAIAEMEGQAHPLLWTFQHGNGRVFASIPGHYTWTFDDVLFRVLALRGVAWAAHQPIERFESLK